MSTTPTEAPQTSDTLGYASPAPYDAYALPPEAIAEPPRQLRAALRKIGPGLILAGSIVGTGELIATTNLGAKVGFGLLWLVIVSCVIKVFVQAELGRYAISSGETTMASFRRLPGPGFVIGWWWVGMTLMTQFQLGAMVGGVGQALHLAMPGLSPLLADGLNSIGAASAASYLRARPEIPWAALTALVTSVWLAVGGYSVIERVTMFMVVGFTFVTTACVALLPAAGQPIGWGEVAQGLTFKIPAGAVVAAIAMFGITGVGASELIAYPYWCIEKGYARRAGANDGSADWLRRARGWLRVMRLDVWVSMGVYTLATLAFYFLGAAVLHRGGAQGLPSTVSAMLTELSRMYAPAMGSRAATWFIVAGVITVLYSTLFSATAANSRAIADFLHVNRLTHFAGPRDRTRWVRGMCVVFPLVDLGLYIWVGNPLLMVIIGAFAQAMTLPMIAAAAVYLRYRRTDRRLAPGKLWDVFLWLSFAGLLATAAYGAYDAVKKAMGK
jgi:manganese transport protein